jgi:TRAP-type mannitol/chloroaromatic compound transport system substrate-binding protein
MHRRGFLTSGGAAAVAAGAGPGRAGANFAPPEAEIPAASPAGARRLTLSLPPGEELAGFAADRLAQRLAVATGGRFRIERGAPGTPCDLGFGDAQRLSALHPGFAFFAGLPAGAGLPSAEFEAWLIIGGGQLLWDELARPFGLKPLLVGHGGEPVGLWSNVRLEQVTDLAGLQVTADGLAARVLERLGARPIAVSPARLRAALAQGEVAAAHWAGPLPAVAFDLNPLAQCLYQPGLYASAAPTTLTVERGLWDQLAPADQAVFEACAAQEHRLRLAEAKLYAGVAAGTRVPSKWPLRRPLPAALRDVLAAAGRAVVAELAEHDAACRRIADSYAAYRDWSGAGA